LNGTHDKVLRTLLVLDSLRGEDSTGVAGVRRSTGDVVIAKAVGHPFELFEQNSYDKIIHGINRVMMGHNRYATQGGVNKKNAHPFEFDTLVGAHNGTLCDKWKLDDAKEFKVDSENLYYHIDKFGLQDAINKLGGAGNAWALVWWDKLESTLNFLRNDQRPFYICRSEDGKTLFWASEKWMLEVALDRHGVKHGAPFLTEVDMHYSIRIDEKGGMDKPQVRKVAAPYVPKFTKVSTTTSEIKHTLTLVQNQDSSKKKEETGTYSSNLYVLSKQVLYEVLCTRADDKTGAEYAVLFDELNPYYEVRLYLRPDDHGIRAHVGKTLRADVSKHVADGRGYYKVSPHTVSLIHEVEAGSSSGLYPTASGTWVDKKTWESIHQSCAWCTSPLDADEENRITSGGECLCPGCASDPQVKQYVNFVN
jgi:hypothetical protein